MLDNPKSAILTLLLASKSKLKIARPWEHSVEARACFDCSTYFSGLRSLHVKLIWVLFALCSRFFLTCVQSCVDDSTPQHKWLVERTFVHHLPTSIIQSIWARSMLQQEDTYTAFLHNVIKEFTTSIFNDHNDVSWRDNDFVSNHVWIFWPVSVHTLLLTTWWYEDAVTI